jgi:hypothetical protein
MLLGCSISCLVIGRLVIAQSCMNSAASSTLTDYIRRRLQHFIHSDQQLDRSYHASPAVPNSSSWGYRTWRLNLREYFIQWPANLRLTDKCRYLRSHSKPYRCGEQFPVSGPRLPDIWASSGSTNSKLSQSYGRNFPQIAINGTAFADGVGVRRQPHSSKHHIYQRNRS